MNPEIDFTIRRLGKTRHPSPLANVRFVRDDEQILYDIQYDNYKSRDPQAGMADLVTMELAGPRKRLYFDPKKVTAGIVTCGGLCPGINNVIRSLFMQLHFQYGVPVILGFRYGFRGILKDSKPGPRTLTIRDVEPIHNLGGSILASSRGSSDPVGLVDGLVHHGIDLLFTIGGDGTIRGSIDIEVEITRRNLDIAVINIPKTIDNDIPFTSKSFGFQTAFTEAVKSIRCAHNEAKGAPNGIGIVKLMGRESGFIAALATLAQED
ncbi:MAG: 6-phosphofructokinase, partial [Candidatus Neomarinimicrobiota bacterium]